MDVGWCRVSSLKSSRKDMESVIPEGANWIKQAVSSFQPENNSVILGDNTVVYYDFLVVAPGLQINWSSIKGLKENIGKMVFALTIHLTMLTKLGTKFLILNKEMPFYASKHSYKVWRCAYENYVFS